MHYIRQYRHFAAGIIGALFLVTCLLALSLWFPGRANAEQQQLGSLELLGIVYNSEPTTGVLAQNDDTRIPAEDQSCRLCHGDSTHVIEFPSGESLSVMVELEELDSSAHGDSLLCTDCHSPADYQFPHEPIGQSDLQSYKTARAATCERCHQEAHLTSHPGPESDMAVTCTDCHGSHDVLTVEQWQSGAGTQVCADCHIEKGVEQIDPVELTQIVRNGLFTDRVDSDYCLGCHSQPGLTMTFPNGDELPLTIDAAALHDSVHGADNSWQALDCTDCHDRYTYPHERPPAESVREYNVQRYTICAKCHEQNYEKGIDSVHGAALEGGNLEAAVCTDCHGAHDTPKPDEPRERISHTCAQCHSGIFDTYSESVHGDALLTDSNEDVPTCINCHGVHDINDPSTALARVRSPQLCAQCHADEELMAEYDISTDVFETYVADFHGTTVTLFEHQDPTVETNKAVCYDCHGVHDIKAVDDPEAGIKVNLLETCRQCHPDATENFPDSWTSHFRPSLQHNPLVFLVDQFYAIIIPLTVGGLGFLVLTDVFRRVRDRLKK